MWLSYHKGRFDALTERADRHRGKFYMHGRLRQRESAMYR
jgi:hypothetical protein